MSRGAQYAKYVHDIDVDAFEEAIGWEPVRQSVNKHGEPEDIGHCPDPWNLHKNGDTTGKFAINRDKKLYGCFVCGGGSLLSLTMAVKDIEDQAAEDWLSQFAHPVDQSDADFMSEIEAILAEEQREKFVMPWYNERVLDKWSDIAPLDEWLKERGISEEVAHEVRLGFQPDAIRFATGVINRDNARSGEHYEGPCVYLPHYWGERLVGWQQRWLEDDRPKWVPKYTNTSNFPKTETVYNWENPEVYCSPRPVIVVESVCTVLFLRSIGFPAVGTFGGAVSETQMKWLRRFNQGVVLAPDNDEPGRKWLDHTEEEKRLRRTDRVVLYDYLARYVPVKVIEPVGGPGNDLGDLMEEGPRFAAEAVRVLYEDARY